MKENQGIDSESSPSHRGAPRADLLDRAKAAPVAPGVYLMKSSDDTILYVGKAKVLKNRIISYFQKTPHDIGRIEFLVQQVHHFDVILTQTESEALLLECTLIKRHKPKYNIRLKDDKAYPYLKITTQDAFPQILWTRKIENDGAAYFGPFPSSWGAQVVRQRLIEKFLLRDCSDNIFKHRSRPCMLYQLEKCSGPCVGLVTAEAYGENIAKVSQVLEGHDPTFRAQIEKEMVSAAEGEHFERAAKLRDELGALDLVTATQSVDTHRESSNQDVFALVSQDHFAQAVYLRIRVGKLISIRHFSVQNFAPHLPIEEALSEAISQTYFEAKGDGAGPVLETRELVVPVMPKDADVLEKAFSLSIRTPQNPQEAQRVAVAQSNAEYSLRYQVRQTGVFSIEALQEIQKSLHLESLPIRIECYDISNFQGDDAVASRVVFIDGAADKSKYRKYKIKTVIGSNDFASMKEVLGRRFANRDDSYPDLVVVDGGKGQLSQAVAILNELGVPGVAVVGLAKARTQGTFRDKEVSTSFERIFIPNRKNPVNLLPHTRAYKLLTHIRDEAHRFAITYHRKVRDTRILSSLDDSE